MGSDLLERDWVAAGVHQAIIAYASDFSLLSTSMLPHGWPSRRVAMMASLDHAIHFHAPARADEWLLYAMDSPRLQAARGYCRGLIFRRDGTLVASSVQEGVVRVRVPRALRAAATEERGAKL